MKEKFKGMSLYCSTTLEKTNYLAKKFDILKIGNDRRNPKFKVFLFEDTPELREYALGFEDYMKNKYNKNK